MWLFCPFRRPLIFFRVLWNLARLVLDLLRWRRHAPELRHHLAMLVDLVVVLLRLRVEGPRAVLERLFVRRRLLRHVRVVVHLRVFRLEWARFLLKVARFLRVWVAALYQLRELRRPWRFSSRRLFERWRALFRRLLLLLFLRHLFFDRWRFLLMRWRARCEFVRADVVLFLWKFADLFADEFHLLNRAPHLFRVRLYRVAPALYWRRLQLLEAFRLRLEPNRFADVLRWRRFHLKRPGLPRL